MKYPIGIQSFERIIEGGYVYVDKTELIYRLTHQYLFPEPPPPFREEPAGLYAGELLPGP